MSELLLSDSIDFVSYTWGTTFWNSTQIPYQHACNWVGYTYLMLIFNLEMVYSELYAFKHFPFVALRKKKISYSKHFTIGVAESSDACILMVCDFTLMIGDLR